MKYGFSQNYFSTGIYSIFSIVTIVILFNAIYFANYKKEKAQINSFAKKEFYLLQLSGALSVGVNITNALAIEHMGVYLTEIISATAPILVLLLAILSKQKKLTKLRMLDVILTVIGTVFAIVF